MHSHQSFQMQHSPKLRILGPQIFHSLKNAMDTWDENLLFKISLSKFIFSISTIKHQSRLGNNILLYFYYLLGKWYENRKPYTDFLCMVFVPLDAVRSTVLVEDSTASKGPKHIHRKSVYDFLCVYQCPIYYYVIYNYSNNFKEMYEITGLDNFLKHFLESKI